MRDITVYNLGNLPTAEVDNFNELQEDFKLYDAERNLKLQMLIITRGFKYAFKAWQDEDGKLWIIDAHQRKRALLELRKSGFTIPPIPYEPIKAANRTEAVEEITAYNSEFAKKNPETKLFEKYNIGTDTLDRFNLELNPIKLEYSEEKPAKLGIAKELEEDEVPALQQDNIFSQPGDIWILDYHRLMCGDSTNFDHVFNLMNTRKADLVITDPPYNINYEGKTENTMKIRNDSMGDGHFFEFLLKVNENMFRLMKDGAAFYVFHADTEGENFRSAMKRAGFKISQCLIWLKNTFTLGRQDYHWQHEPILYGWKATGSHNWYGSMNQSTVIKFDKPLRNAIHPTMKPVGLIGILVDNSSKENDIVVDLFGGSGTTLIACSQMNRINYTMEYDPVFVDVIVRRYYNKTKTENIRLIRDGKEFLWENIKNAMLCYTISQC
jgi:DNA modification methylase